MAKVAFRLVMPEREVLATEADMVVVPGSEGDFGVLHGHAPQVAVEAGRKTMPSGLMPGFAAMEAALQDAGR